MRMRTKDAVSGRFCAAVVHFSRKTCAENLSVKRRNRSRMMYEIIADGTNQETCSKRLRSGLGHGTLPSIVDHEFRELLLSRALQSINDAGHCHVGFVLRQLELAL